MADESVLGPGLGDAAKGPDLAEVEAKVAAFRTGVSEAEAKLAQLGEAIAVGQAKLAEAETVRRALETRLAALASSQ